MKKIIYVLIFGVASFTLNSCDWFDDVTKKDVNFNTDLAVDLHIEQEEEGEITEKIVLDPLSDEDFSQYKNDIKKIEITSLNYRVSDLKTDHESLIFNGKIEYTIGAGNKIPLITLEDLDIKSLNASGQEEAFEVPAAALVAIVKAFESHNEVALFLSGTFSEVPVDFHMEITAKLKVQAEIEI